MRNARDWARSDQTIVETDRPRFQERSQELRSVDQDTGTARPLVGSVTTNLAPPPSWLTTVTRPL